MIDHKNQIKDVNPKSYMKTIVLPILILYLCLWGPAIVSGQAITADEITNVVSVSYRKEVIETYSLREFRPLWGQPTLRKELKDLISKAEMFGLDQKDYEVAEYLESGNPRNNLVDIKTTETALKLLYHLAFGNRHPNVEFRGLDYRPEKTDLPTLLTTFMDQENLRGLASRIQPPYPEYRNALQDLQRSLELSGLPEFSDIKVHSTKAHISNRSLVLRLGQLGFIKDSFPKANDSILHNAIRAAQKKFGLIEDGKLRGSLITALNIPIRERVDELKILLNIIRWSSPLREKGPSILLNITSGTLLVYDSNQLQLFSKVITGKKNTATPALTSRIDQVILYPYWVVPYKIATRELLPRIKKDVSYLSRNNFQVINSNGKQIDPRSINWRLLSPSYFPYTLRQATGCDNSLGLIKFDFQNPFSVYLHDTPGKELFEMNRRFFSHGCMRVEKPVELAHILLGENKQAIDTLTEKGCLFNQKPIQVKAERPAALAIFYSTAWYTPAGEIFFIEDVYKKLRKEN